MRARVLPREEWVRLANDDVCALLKYAHPEDVDIIVVEVDDDIAAQVMLAKITHVECLRVDPKHRNAGVGSALIRLMLQKAKEAASEQILAGAADDKMLGVLARMGAVHVPVQFYTLGIGD